MTMSSEVLLAPPEVATEGGSHVTFFNISKQIPKGVKRHCGMCRQHGVVAQTRNHACEFKNCECPKCVLVRQRRSIMSMQIRLRREQDKMFVRTAEPEQAEIVPPSKTAEAHTACYFCQKCKNHGLLMWKKDHKKACAYADCRCGQCELIDTRRALDCHMKGKKRAHSAIKEEPSSVAEAEVEVMPSSSAASPLSTTSTSSSIGGGSTSAFSPAAPSSPTTTNVEMMVPSTFDFLSSPPSSSTMPYILNSSLPTTLIAPTLPPPPSFPSFSPSLDVAVFDPATELLVRQLALQSALSKLTSFTLPTGPPLSLAPQQTTTTLIVQNPAAGTATIYNIPASTQTITLSTAPPPQIDLSSFVGGVPGLEHLLLMGARF